MKIYNKNQYYEAHTRSRLLSIYGTGSVIPTTWGMIMPENIEEWDFIKETLERVKNLEENEPEKRQKELSISLRQIKISLINDRRFIQFLQQEKGYEQLEFLVSVPYAELSIWNTLSKDYNNLPIPTTAVHFPKYLYDPDFKTKDTELKEYTQWKELFVKSFSKFTDETYIKENHFVPPRTYKPRENATNKTLKEEVISRRTLVPVPVILLCPHGHITDIPWAKYINYFSINRKEKLEQEDGEQERVNLFNIDNCCANPDLLWIGGNMTSEGFEGMSVKCKSCGKSASLRHITSIKPICNGDKPWQEGQNDICTATMQYAITTSNNLYYPQGVNCLYIPFHLISDSVDNNNLRKLEDFYNQYCEKNYVSKQEFINQEDFLITAIFKDSHERKKLISHFLGNNQN
ncbi:MAG: hypothetical protein GXO49_02580, partial [Chlorobi bacterium]|nr:hypothetical protein [Chlorobiota bacterium]